MYAGKMGKTVSVKKYKNREKQTMKKTTEFTPTAFILGILLAVVFGGANAYLGLRVGMTVSASIPAAVISMGIVRLLLKRDSILENNMVQTIGSAGESLAAGAIFTLPALFMWAKEHGTAMPSFFTIAMLAISGGLLGVLFMVPLRHALIVEEHDRLPYPEGTACSKVLLAGEEGGAKAKKVLKGLLAAAVYKFLADGLKLFPSEVDFESRKLRGAGFGIDVLPALVGVGYICGARVSSYLLSGAVLGWLVLMPAFVLVGGDNILFPATRAIGTLTTWELWGNYIRYIGAGAVAAGGIISLVKTLPLIVTTFRKAVRGYGNTGRERTERDIPMRYVIIGIVAILLFLCVMPQIRLSVPMALFIAVFGFFFATVSARMVGLVGSSNNPVSGNRDIAACILCAEINRADRIKRNDSCNLNGNGHLYCRGNGRGYVAGFENWFYRRGNTVEAAGWRADRGGCFRTCNRWCAVSVAGSMELRRSGASGTAGNIDEAGCGRCDGRLSAVGTDSDRRIYRSCG